MKGTIQDIDLSILTDDAKKELIDFYQFLRERYEKKGIKKTQRFKRLISNPLKVKNIIIPDRQELYER